MHAGYEQLPRSLDVQTRSPDEQPVEQARAVLHTHAFRATPQRLALLAELITEPPPGHLSIAELHRRVRIEGRPVDYSTVFRAVTALADAGVLHALAVPEAATTYGLTHRPHHHAVCNACGQVTEIPAERLSGALARAREASALALPASGSLTLHGVCGGCDDPTGPEAGDVGRAQALPTKG